MENTKQSHTQRLAEMQLWAADEMKNLAHLTHDPQMKTKYEQIAGINRMFYETLALNTENKAENSDILKEIKLITRAYYVEKALFDAASGYSVERQKPDKIDEIVDRQTIICRELLLEADQRLLVINDR